jgi:putative transposase
MYGRSKDGSISPPSLTSFHGAWWVGRQANTTSYPCPRRSLACTLGKKPPPGLLHHSDRGSPYGSGDYGDALTKVGAIKSMSHKGNCWINPVAESFFASLKGEKRDHEQLKRVPKHPMPSTTTSSAFTTLYVVIRRSGTSAQLNLK